MSIPQNLKLIRAKLGITQEAFAALFKLTRAAINNYEQGKALPSTEFLLLVCNMANISIEQLCYDDLREEDLSDMSIDQVEDPATAYARRRNLYDLRDLVKEVKRLREEIEQLKKKE